MSPPPAINPRSDLHRVRRIAAWLFVLTVVAVIAILGGRWPDLARWLQSQSTVWQGPLGPLLFGCLYVLAVVLMLPASPLTLLAGAAFGPWFGFLIVSAASTTGAALAFLVSRNLGRTWIVRLLSSRPSLSALDRAIAHGGWRIVVLLRLSPLVPFNVQNYFYGLTSVRFGPCILASWIAMMPGTWLYVGLGVAGRAGLEALAGRKPGLSPTELTLLAVGILATLVLTVYLARLTRAALRSQLPEPDPGSAAPE